MQVYTLTQEHTNIHAHSYTHTRKVLLFLSLRFQPQFVCVFWKLFSEMVSCYVCSPGWPRIGCGDQAGLELAALLFPLPLGLQTLWLVRTMACFLILNLSLKSEMMKKILIISSLVIWEGSRCSFLAQYYLICKNEVSNLRS